MPVDKCLYPLVDKGCSLCPLVKVVVHSVVKPNGVVSGDLQGEDRRLVIS